MNLCTDHLRRQRTAGVQVPLDTVAEVTADPGGSATGSPEVALIRKEFQNAVLEALQGLSPEIRMVVSLALIEGHSYQEIADIARCPVGTVRSRLSRGRQHLQRVLVEHAATREFGLRVIEGSAPSSGAPSSGAPSSAADSREGRLR